VYWKKSKLVMKQMTIKEFIEEFAQDEVMLADGFDSAFMGIASINETDVAVYDEVECINVLRRDGMSGSEAREYFDFNVKGSHIGDQTPVYVNRFTQNLTATIENAD
jgi:hypothetical protein